MSQKFNSRYLAYCRATGGLDPDATMARDAERWPGGLMCGAILWVNDHWREWERENDRPKWDDHSRADHEAFDRWLDERYPPRVEQAALNLEAA